MHQRAFAQAKTINNELMSAGLTVCVFYPGISLKNNLSLKTKAKTCTQLFSGLLHFLLVWED